MRVLLSCLQSAKSHPLPPYDFWRHYFVHGFREAGITCIEVPGVDWAEGLVCRQGREILAWRSRTWDNVLAFVRKEQARCPIDFFLGYLYPQQVEAAAIDELQRMGIPCVNFFCDNVREFRRSPAEYRSFALHWVPEFEALPIYRRAGLPHVHAPMPCWVPPQLRVLPAAETEPSTFIGSADALRRDLIGRAMQAGADLVVRGLGWTAALDEAGESPPRRSLARLISNQVSLVRTHGLDGLYHKLGNRLRPLSPPLIPPSTLQPPVSNEEYVRITREAIVTVGINRVPTVCASNRNPLVYSRLRDLEAPMLGACYLTEWTQGVGQLYELGSEIETYRTPDELGTKLVELKKDKGRRKLMRERAQHRALADHSIRRSLGLICRQLGLRPQP